MKALLIVGGLVGAGALAWAATAFAKTKMPGQVKGTNTVRGKSGKSWLLVADGKATDGLPLYDVYVGPGVYPGIDAFAPVLQFKEYAPTTPGQHGQRVLSNRYPAAATLAYPDALSDFEVQAA